MSEVQIREDVPPTSEELDAQIATAVQMHREAMSLKQKAADLEKAASEVFCKFAKAEGFERGATGLKYQIRRAGHVVDVDFVENVKFVPMQVQAQDGTTQEMSPLEYLMLRHPAYAGCVRKSFSPSGKKLDDLLNNPPVDCADTIKLLVDHRQVSAGKPKIQVKA